MNINTAIMIFAGSTLVGIKMAVAVALRIALTQFHIRHALPNHVL